MSQNDFTLANQSFPAFRADLNSALQALATNSSGGSAPSTTFANMWWYDTSNNIMYIRNEDNDAWIKFAELDQANDKFVLSGTLQLDDGTVSAPALTFNSDTNMGIYRGGTDILKFVTAGTDAITIDASQNVGIGVSPDQLLHVKSSGNTRAKIEAGTTSSFGQLYLGTENQFLIAYGSTHANEPNHIGLRNTNASGEIFFVTGGSAERMRITSGGDFQLYEDTGSTPKFFWDASAETLSIGQTSGNYQLHVQSTFAVGASGFNQQLSFTNDTIQSLVLGSGYTDLKLNPLGGNLLVGTTNTNPSGGNVEGTVIQSDGMLRISREGTSIEANIKGSDGNILVLKKDGGTIGSIGVNGSNPFLANSSSRGISLGSNVVPCDSSGAKADNVSDLGIATGRFKDLYLSGTIEIEQGTGNVAVGKDALSVNTGTNSTAVGYEAGLNNSTGVNNAFFGYFAGHTNTGSSNNALLGAYSGRNLTGSQSTFVGQGAGETMTSGSKNTILGRYNGNQGGLDIRTSNNYIVLSDGEGNARIYNDGTSTTIGRHTPVKTSRGVLELRGVNASQSAITNSDNSASYTNGATINFNARSGVLIVNNWSNGSVELFVMGGGSVSRFAGSGTGAGTVTYVGPNYVWTNDTGSTHTFTHTYIQTRNSV